MKRSRCLGGNDCGWSFLAVQHWRFCAPLPMLGQMRVFASSELVSIG